MASKAKDKSYSTISVTPHIKKRVRERKKKHNMTYDEYLKALLDAEEEQGLLE